MFFQERIKGWNNHNNQNTMPRRAPASSTPTRQSARIAAKARESNDPEPRDIPAAAEKGRSKRKPVKKERHEDQPEVEYTDSHPRSTRNRKTPVAGPSSRKVSKKSVVYEEDSASDPEEDPGSDSDEDSGNESEEEPLEDPDAHRSRGARGRKPATINEGRRRSSGYGSDDIGRARHIKTPVTRRAGGTVEVPPPTTKGSEDPFVFGSDERENSRKRRRDEEGNAIDERYLFVPQAFQGVGFAPQDIDKNSVETPDEGYESEEIGLVRPVGQVHEAKLVGDAQLVQFSKGPGGFFGVYRYGPRSHGIHILKKIANSQESLPANLLPEINEAERGGVLSRYSKHRSVKHWPQKPPKGSIYRIHAIAVYSDGILKKLRKDDPGDYDRISALDAKAWEKYQAPLLKLEIEWVLPDGTHPFTWEWRTTAREYMYPGDIKRTFLAEIEVEYNGQLVLIKGDTIFMADQTIILTAVRMEVRYDRWLAGQVKDAGSRAPSFSPIPPRRR
jgi:hypothetical protein